jgi:hypothetical protein
MVVERMAQIMLGNAGRPVAMSAFPMRPAHQMLA